jgi:excisionase family DNA binding protein
MTAGGLDMDRKTEKIPRLALNLQEAAESCGVSHWKLRKDIRLKKLRAYYAGRRVLVTPADLKRYLFSK